MNSIDTDMLEALRELVKHNEKVNHAFYVVGTGKAMREAMPGQKALLDHAREAIARAEGKVTK